MDYLALDSILGCYRRDVMDIDTHRAQTLERLMGFGRSCRVLELGSGGGQFAVEAARGGHSVVAIELESLFSDHAKNLAETYHVSGVEFVTGDFTTFASDTKFDAICYWDGFGFEDDSANRRLLQAMGGMLAPGGKILLEVFSTPYWSRSSGVTTKVGPLRRDFEFDDMTSRLIDTWSREERIMMQQSMRCYTPPDLDLLLQGTGLLVNSVESRGGWDWQIPEYRMKRSFHDSMLFLAALVVEG